MTRDDGDPIHASDDGPLRSIPWKARWRDASEAARRDGRPVFVDFYDPG